MKTPEEIVRFCETWRQKIVDESKGKPERLSDERYGQLVALNTIIYYIREM